MKNVAVIIALVLLALAKAVQADPASLVPTNTQILFPDAKQPYLVELSLADRSDEARKQATIKGLTAVISKNSNIPQVIEIGAIKDALAKPELYLKRFNYLTGNNVDGQKVNFLQLYFDQIAITKLLQRASSLTWIKNKPLTLMWLAQDTRGGKIIDGSSDNPLASLIKSKAQDYGMSIMMPIMDFQDLAQIKTNEICRFDWGKLKMASKRYDAAAIIVGCIKKSIFSGQWGCKWQLLQNGQTKELNLNADTQENLMIKSLTEINNLMAITLVPVSSEDSRVILRITHITGFEGQQVAIKYLRELSKLIKEVEVVNISANDLEIAINIIGGQKGLLTILAAQNRLVPNFDDDKISPPGVDLSYSWMLK